MRELVPHVGPAFLQSTERHVSDRQIGTTVLAGLPVEIVPLCVGNGVEVDLESAEVSPSVTTTPRRHQSPLTELHKASHHIKLKSCT